MDIGQLISYSGLIVGDVPQNAQRRHKVSQSGIWFRVGEWFPT
jgi:hypothetical protein